MRKSVEDRVFEINDLLKDDELNLIESTAEANFPVNLIIGAPRSASTVLTQILARSGQFGYISNFVAKFWNAPVLGLGIESTFDRIDDPITFQSDYGLTSSLNAPHEFSYFWRRWFPHRPDHLVSTEEFNTNHPDLLKQEINAISSHFGKPIFFKNLSLSLQMNHLERLGLDTKYIICLRDPFYQAQSILRGRLKFHNNLEDWYSIRPAEYHELKQKNPYDQVVGQIYYILQQIERSLAEFKLDTPVIMRYEEFVKSPKELLDQIAIVNQLNRINIDPEYVANKLINTNKITDDKIDTIRLANTVNKWFDSSAPFELYSEINDQL